MLSCCVCVHVHTQAVVGIFSLSPTFLVEKDYSQGAHEVKS